MMKLLLSILSFLITSNTFSQWLGSSPGRVKITLVKFFSLRETADDLLDGDGKKDEIFFSFMYTVSGINGNTKLSSKTISGVFGDATGTFVNRTSAGSATDIFGNNRGGIKTGDVVSCNFPVLDIVLDAGDVISIVPSIWEWDNNNFNVQQSFEGAVMAAFPQMNTKIVENVRYCYPKTDDQSCFVRNGTGYLGIPNCAGILQSVSNKPGNRPIGMTQTGDYSPIVISMGANLLEQVASMQFRNIGTPGHTNPGNLPVSFNEEAIGNTRDHGNFGIYLKVEFIKTTPSADPVQSSKNMAGIKKELPSKNINISNTQLTVAGNWSGTKTTDSGLYPQNFGFELNGNGEILMKDLNGNIAVKGTYTLTNNVFSGSYKQQSSGETYSFAGTYDPAAQILSGSLGNGTATTGQGKWTVTKR